MHEAYTPVYGGVRCVRLRLTEDTELRTAPSSASFTVEILKVFAEKPRLTYLYLTHIPSNQKFGNLTNQNLAN